MEQFSHDNELLEDFYASYEHLENSISAMEQCMWLKVSTKYRTVLGMLIFEELNLFCLF